MATQMSTTMEIEQLRKKLLHARGVITELQEELKEQESVRYKLTVERDKYRAKILETKDAIKRMDEIIQMKVNEAISEERANHRRTEQELIRTKDYLKQIERRREELEAKNVDFDERLKDLQDDYDFLEGKTGTEALQQKMGIIKELKDDKRNLTQQLTDMSADLEDILAENRILRKMNNVPDNWGCEPQKRIIKLQDRETVFEYKRLVKVLQEDNYNLEKERARLKHRLKQLYIYSGMSKDEKYKDLTPEQVVRLNEFLIRLREGETEDDKSMYELLEENKALKKELEVLTTKGYDVIRKQLESFFRENKNIFVSSAPANLTEDQLKYMNSLQKQQEKMQGLIDNIWGGMAGGSLMDRTVLPSNDMLISQDEAYKFGPPRVTGIGTGYSTKFDTKLNIPMGGAANPKDLPALQLQLIEMFALNERKDGQIKMLENELERAYTRVRRYLLMQDQLYLNYADELQGFKEKTIKHELDLSNAKDELRTEQIKNENYRKLLKSLKLDEGSISSELVNAQKKLALVEVDNFKLSKKYAIIYEQEKQLRDAYHKIEEGFTDRERFATERITKLKEWQIKTINELKFLYSKFRDAIPLGEYQAISKDLFIYKQKFADMMEKCNRQAIANSRLQTENRELLTAGERLKLYEEIKIDTENELEVIKKRLELIDPLFKWENAVFNRIIAILKNRRISPRQVFDHFDKDGNGKLTTREFLRALDEMGIGGLDGKEKEILVRSIDADMDGTVDYREFCRKCARHGVQNRSKQDEIVYIIDENLKRHGLELSEMFEVMDKKGKGVITKEDFKDTLIASRVKVDRKDLENFIDLFWKGRAEGINYRDFVRIYNRFKVRFDEDDKNNGKVSGRFEVTDEMIERMKWIFDKLNQIFKDQDMSLREAFEKIDQSPDKQITRIELKRMFDAMGVTVRDKELEMMFKRMDFDESGAISYLEFEAEFTKIVDTPLETLQALNNETKRVTSSKYSGGAFKPVSEDYLLSDEITHARKINILESKVDQFERKVDMYKERLQKSEQSQISWERDYDFLEKKYLEINEKYQLLLQQEQATNTQLIGTLSKEKSEELVLKAERQKEKITDLQAAMDSYKSLFEIASSQAKTLKLSNKRARDEEENLMYALRELQSDSIEKHKLGRIYYILMLSRWQEAAIGMKYDYVLNDVRTLRHEYTVLEFRIKKEEDKRHESENQLRDRGLQVEKLKQELHAKSASGISMARAEEISKALQDMADEKTDVEEKYIKLYSENGTMKYKLKESESRLEHSESLLAILKNSNDSEIADRLIEMADKISQIRRNELRCKRESEEYQEKSNYAEKRLSQQKKNIVDLEDQLADLEALMHRKEEEWRRIDMERQKKFFDQQFTSFETEKRYQGYADDGLGLARDKFARDDLISPPTGEFLVKKEAIRKLQADLRNHKDEIINLKATVLTKDKQLERFREWQIEDKLLSEDEKLNDIIQSRVVKVDQMHEKESREMAQAAFKTIKTLQSMVDDKNKQCKRKEDIIKELRERMAEEKQADTREIVRLNDELSKALKDRSDVEYSFKESHRSKDYKEYEAISRRELEKLCYQKDDVIDELETQLNVLRREKEYLLQNKDAAERDNLNARHDDLSNQSTKRIRALQKDVDRLTRQLNDKQKVEDRLNDTIRQITDKLIRLEEMKGITDEDIKMDRLTKNQSKHKVDSTDEDPRIKELEKMLKAKERRLTTTTARLKHAEKELREEKEANLKHKETEHELREEVKNGLKMRQKLIDNYQKEKRDARRKEREDKKDKDSKLEKSTNLELRAIIKDLEREIKVLKSQQNPIVSFNSQSGAFEYIGEPTTLKSSGEPCESIEEVLKYAKEWLKINDRLTVGTIFNSFDYNKSGLMEKELLYPIFTRLGIKLYEEEMELIAGCITVPDDMLLKYRPLVLELTTGPAQIEFISKACKEIAKLCLKHNVGQFQLLNEIDKGKTNECTLAELKDGLDVVFPRDVSNKTADDIFKQFRKLDDNDKMVATDFCDEVRKAVVALIIAKVKLAVEAKGREYAHDAREGKLDETKGLNLDNEFSRIDKEHDGFLTYDQFRELLDVYEIDDLKANAIADLNDLLDIDKKFLISLAYLKQILDLPKSPTAGDAHFGLDMKPMKDSFRQKEDMEIADNARAALRRIYQNNNLLERLYKQLKVYDTDKDGVMSRSLLRQAIVDVTKDVHDDDIGYIVQYADKRSKGYFNPEHFFENIIKLAQTEAKNDAILRRLGNVLRHKGIDLETELNKSTKHNAGVIDTYDFMRAMRELRIGLDSNDMDQLVNFATQNDKFVEIKWFCKKVDEALTFKPMSVTVPRMKRSLDDQKGGISDKEQKKIQQKIQALTNQLNDTQKELERVEKTAEDWKMIAEKNEKQLNILADKLMDPKDKTKKIKQVKAASEETDTKHLKMQLKQQERILELDNKLEDLQRRNEELLRQVEVENAAKVKDYETRANAAEKKLTSIKSENYALQSQIDKLISASTYPDELKHEEAEYAKQMNTKNLEHRINDLEKVENDLRKQVLKYEHSILDMKLDRELNQAKIFTLKDKIADLETYISIHSQLPKALRGAGAEENLDQVMAKATGLSKRSNAELEKVIDGLKRVINTQKGEIEDLKHKVKHSDRADKKSTNKQLKDELNDLERELKVVAEKDLEISELELKADKLAKANKALKKDIDNEQQRYEFLEGKYKQLLVKYNVACKDLEIKQNSLFSMSTGANKATYQDYLLNKENAKDDKD